jgi:hypothetical protein
VRRNRIGTFSVETRDFVATPPFQKPSALVGVLTIVMALGLSAVAVWTAWDYGGGLRRTQFVGSAIVLGMIPLGVLAAWKQSFVRLPAVVVLAMAVWLVSAVQCVPLPPAIVNVLSPGSLLAYREWLPEAIRNEALEDSESPASTIATTAIPISVSPTFTRMAMALPLLLAAGCWLSSLCFVDRRAALILLATPAVVGALFAFFGLADMIRLARDSSVELRQRLIITPVGADGPFGPFINNNTGAGYLNLTIGCAVGLLLGMRYRGKEDSQVGLFRHWQAFLCVLLIVVMVAGILGSGSRGGFLGLMLATVVLSVLGTRGWARLGLVAVLAVIGVTSLLFLDELGIRDQTFDRLETLYDGTAANDPRLRIWEDGIDAALAHLPLGAGFGAYRYANLPYQEKTGNHWAVNADGMHVEWLLEGGVWLIPVVLVGVVLIVREVRRLERLLPEMPLHEARLARAVTVATTFSLASLFATQSFDFGITHIPLVLTLAIPVGGVFRLRREARPAPLQATSAFDRRLRIVVGTVGTSALALAVWDLHAGGIWQEGMIDRYDQRRVPITQRSDLDEQIAKLERVVRSHPSDAMAHRTLAQLLLDRQHQIGAFALLDQDMADTATAEIWASPQNVRKAFYSSSLDLESLMLGGQDPEQWRRARRHAVTALVLSPLDDTARVLVVETDFVDEGRNAATGELLVQTARLRPQTPRVLDYVESLATVFPRGETLAQVQVIKRNVYRK